MVFHTGERIALFDKDTQEVIDKRFKEFLGLVILAVGGAFAAMLWTYSPTDPSFTAVSDQPIHNALGRTGASVASWLMFLVGVSAWSVPAMLGVWAVRFMLHAGAARLFRRIIFLPLLFAVAAIYASTLIPSEAWHNYSGLGGRIGDTLLMVVLHMAPLSPALGVMLMSFVSAGSVVALALVVGGFDRSELVAAYKHMRAGVLLCLLYLRLGVGLILAAAFRGLRAGLRTMFSRLMRGGRGAEHDGGDGGDGSDAFALGTIEASPLLVSREGREGSPEIFYPEGVDGNSVDQSDEPRSGWIGFLTRPFARSAPSDDADMGGDREGPLGPPHAYGRPEPTLTRNGQRGPLEDAPTEDNPVPERVIQPMVKPTVKSSQAKMEAQPDLAFEDTTPTYKGPPLSLLTDPSLVERHHLSAQALEENARMLESVLIDYGVRGEIVSVRPGPVVTMYELEPAPGLKASRVIGLADDIARSMSALSARVSTVPGRSVIGIELPNEKREHVVLRELLSHREFGDSSKRLPLALGKDIGGEPIVANLSKMPHLLIAGTTGSGKSVAINTMIMSLLYRLTPEDCRLIMIDPKMLELSVYDGIPHLLSPVVTDPKKAVVALKWVVGEMENRYRKMSKMGVRNIEGYNSRVADALSKGELFSRTVQTGFDEETGEPTFQTEEFAPEKLPLIVVIVDEMADLMMVAGKEIEACIQRLAQMARASGIHLIMATQRPSVDVITGTIKANFPTRISFQVTSKIDSRTILGEQGAEQLLGMGDMLYMAGGGKITRIHGPFVSDEEVEEIVNHLKSQGPPVYLDSIVAEAHGDHPDVQIDEILGLDSQGSGDDALYDQAVAIVIKDRKCSTSYIQRKLAIGYNKAARIVEKMEDNAVVSAANAVGKRDILVPERS